MDTGSTTITHLVDGAVHDSIHFSVRALVRNAVHAMAGVRIRALARDSILSPVHAAVRAQMFVRMYESVDDQAPALAPEITTKTA